MDRLTSTAVRALSLHASGVRCRAVPGAPELRRGLGLESARALGANAVRAPREVRVLVAARDGAEPAALLSGVVPHGRSARLARGRGAFVVVLDAMTPRAKDFQVVEAEEQLNASLGEGVRDVMYLHSVRPSAPRALPFRETKGRVSCGAPSARAVPLHSGRVIETVVALSRPSTHAVGSNPNK